MSCSIFWDVMPCSLIKDYRHVSEEHVTILTVKECAKRGAGSMVVACVFLASHLLWYRLARPEDGDMFLLLAFRHRKQLWAPRKQTRDGDSEKCMKEFYMYCALICRSQRPLGLRYELFSLAPTLISWVRTPLKAWMFVCAFILCLCCLVCR
jgi:hypothetical protein